jgi:hypothetical protein
MSHRSWHREEPVVSALSLSNIEKGEGKLFFLTGGEMWITLEVTREGLGTTRV